MIFHSDLDNTIIFSYKHDIGAHKVQVELYQGRHISFVTEKTREMLKKVNERMLFVPTTTRTQEQYARINLGIGTPRYALVCNGGVLLVDGEEDSKWYQDSLRLVEGARKSLDLAYGLLEQDRRRMFELRNIRDLFLFTKCESPDEVVNDLRAKLGAETVEVFHNGPKVYVVPRRLSKGQALLRFRERLPKQTVIAAGDSEFDISMLNAADLALAPEMLRKSKKLSEHTIYLGNGQIFSDQVLAYVLDVYEKQHRET